MKIKIQEVGEGGTFILPLPKSMLSELGWKDGDELNLDIPDYRFNTNKCLIFWRKRENL